MLAAIGRGGIALSEPFPSAPEALTTRWLSDALGAPVAAFEVAPLGEGVGVIGSVNRVRLEGDGVPSSAIIKFPSPSPENRAVAQTYDMYGREVRFYREQAALVPVRTPHCYAAEFDAGSGDFVLLLEDLAQCRQGDQVEGAGLEDARHVVDALAALHAATWERDLGGIPSHNFPAQREGIAAGMRAGWPTVLERFAELVSSQARERAPALPEHIGALIERLTEGPQSLVHADVRLDNVLFDGATPVLVDWQSVCRCAGEQDLAYFLTQSVPDGLRDRHLDGLLTRYHEALLAGGVQDYPLAACRERFRVATVYLLAWAVVIAGTLDLGNDRGHALGAALLGRSLRSVAATDGFDLLR